MINGSPTDVSTPAGPTQDAVKRRINVPDSGM